MIERPTVKRMGAGEMGAAQGDVITAGIGAKLYWRDAL